MKRHGPPDWVSCLMGFPVDWLHSRPSATPSSRKSRKRSGGQGVEAGYGSIASLSCVAPVGNRYKLTYRCTPPAAACQTAAWSMELMLQSTTPGVTVTVEAAP